MTHIRWEVLWILFGGLILDITQAEFATYGSPVLLDEVKELHFHKGQDTSYKRLAPLPQLRCTRGCEFEPGTLVDDYWQGFHSDEDEEVLEGSCALEYTLTHAGWALYGHSGNTAFDPKMKGWSASWIVITAVVGYLLFHVYNAVSWIQEFKALLERLRIAMRKGLRWLQSLRDEVIPVSATERACCRFNTRHKRDRNGKTHDGPHCPDHCQDIDKLGF